MKQGRLTLAVVAAALVLTGAAVAATAMPQSKGKTTRKSAPRTPAPTPTPVAKKNARAEDGTQQTPQTEPVADSPAKKNSRSDGGTPAPAATPVPVVESARTVVDDVRYSFEFTQPQFIVRRFLIEHDATGRGKLTFERKNEDAALTEPIEITPAAYARIVAAWEALKFLDSEASYQADKQFPHLGTMRLRMKRGGRERMAEFNWTHNDHVSALAHEYRALAEQQLFVFDMATARQYQPSEAIKLLKRLEFLINNKQVSDATQLSELLRDLVTDERIPLIARNHAERLLKKIEK